MLTILRRLLLILQFFTALPLPFNVKAEEKDFGKGLVFAPLVGLLIGALLMVCQLLFEISSLVILPAILVMALYIFLTGGLHLDGLGDTFDGLNSHRSREKMLEIIKVHYDHVEENLLAQAMEAFYWIREMKEIQKKPSTSELLDWLQALMISGIPLQKIKEEIPFVGVLLRKNQDIDSMFEIKEKGYTLKRWL